MLCAALYSVRASVFEFVSVAVVNLASGLFLPHLWNMLQGYQKDRFLSFLNPAADPFGVGYHTIQSQIAIGAGGFFGSGFLHGTQTQLQFIPQQWTDFIFSAVGEELGFVGYIDHMLGRPRGILALSIVMPIMMFVLHVLSELVRPISLSLRLRSNIWGDDLLVSVLAGFGVGGTPLLVFDLFLTILAAVVQAVVFCLLSSIYFALILSEEH